LTSADGIGMETPQPYVINRKYPRRIFENEVGILFQGKYYICGGGEVGEGGLSFYSSAGMKIGSKVIVTFQIDHRVFMSEKAVIKSIVKQDYGSLFGLAFLNISFENKRIIRTYVCIDREMSEDSVLA
jgi:hypothetical protein